MLAIIGRRINLYKYRCNIFEKVGVRSRKALLKHLFFDQLLPSLLGD